MITITKILLSSYELGRSVVSIVANSTNNALDHLLVQGVLKMKSNKIKLIIGMQLEN